MFGFGSQTSTLFDSGLSSALTNSTNNSITSGSPPVAFTSSYIDRPDALFSSLYGADNSGSNSFASLAATSPTQSSPTEALTSLLEPFGFSSVSTAGQTELAATLAQLTGQNLKMDRLPSSTTIARPTSFNTSSLFSNEYVNPLGSSLSQLTSQMSVGNNLSSPFGSQQHTPVATPTNGAAPPPKNPKLYKTELCRTWMDHGRCNYGERCQYAHGDVEKRPVPRHPKYKTEACQSFHQTGYCPYGPRCHFIHNEPPTNTPFPTPISTPQQQTQHSQQATTPGQPSLYASQYHNMNMQKNPSGVPSNVLQRVYSLPGGYGSAGESPAGSSNDSGSESPNGSFSPGPDMDEHSQFSLFSSPTKTAPTTQHHQPSRFLSYDASNFNDTTQFSNLLNDLNVWNIDDSLANAISGFSSTRWSTDDLTPNGNTPKSTPTTNPSRLPVFAQLSNPQ